MKDALSSFIPCPWSEGVQRPGRWDLGVLAGTLSLQCPRGKKCQVLRPDSTTDSFLVRVYSICLISGFPSSDILQGNFKPDFYLKYIQKDLRLAIALGDAVNHPTPMAAAANEVPARGETQPWPSSFCLYYSLPTPPHPLPIFILLCVSSLGVESQVIVSRKERVKLYTSFLAMPTSHVISSTCGLFKSVSYNWSCPTYLMIIDY